MKKFKKFEIKNQTMVFGGKVVKTIYENNDGSSGLDMYDCETGRCVNILGQEM